MLVTVLALIFGIWFTVRKLDVRKREPEHFPNVDRAAFERWKQIELSAYNVGSFACFAMIFLDYAFRFAATRWTLDWTLVRIVGASLFFAWVAALVYTGVKAGRGRRLRDELGIDLSKKPPEPDGPDAEDRGR